MYRSDPLYSRSIMASPFINVEPIATFPGAHRHVEPPVPTQGRNSFAQMTSQRTNLYAASGKGAAFHSTETRAHLAAAARTIASASAGSLASRRGLPTALAAPMATSLATAQMRLAHLAADDRNALNYHGGGFAKSIRLDHLHRSQGSSDSRSAIGFAPLGYPRVMKLSEPIPQLWQLRPPTSTGPSIFGSVASRGSSRGGF